MPRRLGAAQSVCAKMTRRRQFVRDGCMSAEERDMRPAARSVALRGHWDQEFDSNAKARRSAPQ